MMVFCRKRTCKIDATLMAPFLVLLVVIGIVGQFSINQARSGVMNAIKYQGIRKALVKIGAELELFFDA